MTNKNRQLLKKSYNIQINLSSVKPPPKKHYLQPQEINGEENSCQNILKSKPLLKMSQSLDPPAVAKPSQHVDWLNQIIPHLLSSIPLNLHKLAMSVKMFTPSFKISKTSSQMIKKVREQQYNAQKARIQNQLMQMIVNILLGKQFSNQQIRLKKISDIKAGHYKNISITFYLKDLQLNSRQFPYHPHLNHQPIKDTIGSVFSYFTQSLFIKLKNQQQKQNANLQNQSIQLAQQNGIVFLDQIDKLISTDPFSANQPISRQGVQRDLLPLLQGSIINTKLGDVDTSNILFIASGSFSQSKVQDLIPQLLGRLPVRVQMNAITQKDFSRILTQPKYNLLVQQIKLFQQQNIKLQFTPDSIQQMSKIAFQLNSNTQNIGARRLQAVIQKIIQDVSFYSTKYQGQQFVVDAKYVAQKLESVNKKSQLACIM